MSGKATELLRADTGGIERAARLLQQGALVAVPTETVYGLAARADSAEAVAEIYRAKGRPDFNPLIVHVLDLADATRLAVVDDRARILAAQFWPGPLTMVLPKRADALIVPAVTAGLDTIALRCPAHPAMRALLGETGLPLAAPSANPSGAVSPTTAGHVLAGLDGRIAAVLDGGPSGRGVESTIVVLREGGWQILRPGPVAEQEIAALLGAAMASTTTKIEAPGQLEKHYSPGKPVRLEAREATADEFFIGFGQLAGDCTLSAKGDLAEAASRLYACLHQAAASGHPRIVVATIPEDGIGAAINDRLRRAAA
jgi:L-threonylcarbamoyladenylate synthase